MLRSFGIALISATILVAAISIGGAAPGANVEPKVGIVDLERVYKEAPRIAQLEEEVTAFNQSLTKKLQVRAQNLLLTEAEVSELVNLQTSASPKPADSSRITQLTDLDRSRTDELTKLKQTQSLTDAQRARLKELQDMEKKSQQAGAALYNDFQTQLQSEANDIHDKEDAEVRVVVGKVGQAKGFTLIADKSMILLGGTDLTSEVISRMERTK